eukprot:CAMPEP_0196219224 /NCGR_PEP_ID=MMETSP0912-20130531/38382_1 /TAXON_ID=49265 /ORGANISM="Thalassiosira rotula, Strain GSO102" /LENGTH=51 /DNA_ID=CAMNT_0041497121 /DNA_START=56 /DNA_END=208 /DNA_ORIENTATION=-
MSGELGCAARVQVGHYTANQYHSAPTTCSRHSPSPVANVANLDVTNTIPND